MENGNVSSSQPPPSRGDISVMMIQGQCLDGQGQCGGQLFHYDECLELIWGKRSDRSDLEFLGRMRVWGVFCWFFVCWCYLGWIGKIDGSQSLGDLGSGKLGWVGWKLKPSWNHHESSRNQSSFNHFLSRKSIKFYFLERWWTRLGRERMFEKMTYSVRSVSVDRRALLLAGLSLGELALVM